MLPHGLPNEFSFGATFRLSPNSKATEDSWYIIYIDDFQQDTQFAIKMNNRNKQIEVIYRNYNYELITMVFGGGGIENVRFIYTAAGKFVKVLCEQLMEYWSCILLAGIEHILASPTRRTFPKIPNFAYRKFTKLL